MSVLPNNNQTSLFSKVMTGLLLTAASVFLAGCSPEAALGSAIVASLIIAEQQSVPPSSRNGPTANPAAAPRSMPRPQPIEVKTPAKVTTSECRQIIDQGMESYENLQWSQADHYFSEVVAKDCLCSEDQARVYLFRGAIAYQSGSVSQAKTYFQQAGKLQPGLSVPKDYFPPPMVDFYQEASRP